MYIVFRTMFHVYSVAHSGSYAILRHHHLTRVYWLNYGSGGCWLCSNYAYTHASFMQLNVFQWTLFFYCILYIYSGLVISCYAFIFHNLLLHISALHLLKRTSA